MSSPSAGAANANLETGIARLADGTPSGERRQFASLTAAATGLPTPMFNRVFVFDPPPRGALAAAVDWLRERAVPFWVVATATTVDSVAGRTDVLGLERATRQPGMVRPALEDVGAPTTDLEITEVTDGTTLAGFNEVTGAAFGLPTAVAAAVNEAGLAMEGVHAFLGRFDGDPVACGTLIRTGNVAGVYNIGVREAYRRRGFGEAITRAVLVAGRAHGCEVATLQSSDVARPLYEGLGFETVVTYHLFEPAD